MNLLAIKMLMGDRLKYFGLIIGMTFAAMMIAQQASIYSGLKSQTGTFIRQLSNVDLFVMDDQVRFSEDYKPIPDTALQQIRGIDGVEWAVPIYKNWLRARLEDGTRLTVIVIGLDDATLTGGPAEMVEGSLADLRRDPGILIDVRDAGTKLKLERSGGAPIKVGDRLSINDTDAVIVGSYKGNPSFFWEPTIYTTYSRALRFAPRERHLMSYVLVKLKPEADQREVQGLIARATMYRAMSGTEFETATSGYILKQTGILVNFGLAVILGLIVGALVTGQTFFNFTLDNLRYFATLRAMGVSSFRLIAMVGSQVFTVTSISFGLGVGLAAAFGVVITKTDLAFLMPWQVLALTGASMFGVASLAALLSLYKVLRLEPGMVFKA